MKKFFAWIKKCKKGFTLIECVCALAVVGLFSALMLPLLSTAMSSFRVSDSIRKTASSAAKNNATLKTDSNQSSGSHQTTLYVTVEYSGINAYAESAFVFTESKATGGYDVVVTYYDLKYGNEGK